MALTYEQIENAIYDKLRRQAVKQGYLPDVALYLGGTNAQNLAAYNAAKAAIRTAGKPVIEVYPVAAAQQRPKWAIGAIMVDKGIDDTGDLGAPGDTYEQQLEDGSFDSYAHADTTYDVDYTVTFFTQDKDISNICQGIIKAALPSRCEMQGLNNNLTTGDRFALMRRPTVDLSTDEMIEKQYRVYAWNVVIDEPLFIENISAITEPQFNPVMTDDVSAVPVADTEQ